MSNTTRARRRARSMGEASTCGAMPTGVALITASTSKPSALHQGTTWAERPRARQIDGIDALGQTGCVLHRGRERHRGARAHNAKKLRPLIEVVDVVNGAHELGGKLAGRHAQVFPR